MQKTLLILSLLAFSAFCLPTRNNELRVLWSSWKDVHQKSYSLAEDAARFAIFMENYKVVIKHNAEHTSHKLGLNIFADLTLEEYRAKLNFKPSQRQYAPEETYVPEDSVIPTSVDWRKKKAVAPVQQQGDCGSCWAFSITGVLEGMRVIQGSKLVTLSAQQILDCLTSQQGCFGGEFEPGFDYAAQYGLETSNDYPYTGQDGDACAYDAKKTVHINSGSVPIAANSTDAFKAAIATMPATMAVDASAQAFQLYTSGVITDCTVLAGPNHSAVAIGYGEMSGVDAYFIKNSWGTSWGDHGYVYITTDASQNGGAGACGILDGNIFIGK